MGRLISQYGLPDLPWQLSGESISQMNPPRHAYRKEQAYIVISNPEAEHVVIWSLLVEPEARGNGLGYRDAQTCHGASSRKDMAHPCVLPGRVWKGV